MQKLKSQKAKDLIHAIGDRVINELYDINDDNYEYEADEYGFKSASRRCSFYFEYGNSGCDVECNVHWGGSNYVECFVYGSESIHPKVYKNLEMIEKYANEYLDENLDTDDLLSTIQDYFADCYTDEWDEHGFRDAADYYHWRYS